MSIKVEAIGPGGATTWTGYKSADEPTIHREGGPAVEVFAPDGDKAEEQWVQEGQFHREDGPAITYYGELEKLVGWDQQYDPYGNPLDPTPIYEYEEVEDYEYWINPGIQNGGPATESVRVETLIALVDEPEQWLIDLALSAKKAGYEGVRK